jgi:transcriptional regulator with XRE-family HTH domain
MEIGDVLRIFRIINDKKIKEVAEEVHCSSTNICDIEANRKKPTLKKLQKLAICYNVTTAQVLLIHEMSIENCWNFQKTMYEALIQWFKTNEPEYLANLK